MVRTGAGQHMAGRDPHNLMVYLFLRVPCVCVCKSRYRRVRRTAHTTLGVARRLWASRSGRACGYDGGSGWVQQSTEQHEGTK